MDKFLLPSDHLMLFLDRLRKPDPAVDEAALADIFLNVLSELNEFIPSETVLVLIDDPTPPKESGTPRDLYYVAGMGEKVAQLQGKKMPGNQGVIGETYTLGKTSVLNAGKDEQAILDKVHLGNQGRSLVCVALQIEKTPIGVLALYNKKDPLGYSIRDVRLTEIFAGYISTSLQNAIDARKSRELSKRDDLTGLYNDRYFHAQLETEIQACDEKRHPLNLLFMDLDNFKSVNDQHGHLVGSRTLREIGFLLREIISHESATLARYGGDEYVVIIPGIPLDQAVEMAERVREAIATKFFMIEGGDGDGSFVSFKGLLSASIGLASLHDHVDPQGTLRERKNLLLRLADGAMYRSKDLGKNCVSVAQKK